MQSHLKALRAGTRGASQFDARSVKTTMVLMMPSIPKVISLELVRL